MMIRDPEDTSHMCAERLIWIHGYGLRMKLPEISRVIYIQAMIADKIGIS